MKTINLKIKEVLKEKNLTRYEVAKRANMKFQTVDKYYKNQVSRYDKHVLLKICLAVDCDLSDILKIEDL